MDSPRRRRPTPDRAGPIRNAGGAFRDSTGMAWDDAAARGVREGYQVIDEQIRRGHRMAQSMGEEDRYGGSPFQEKSWLPRYPEKGWHRAGRGGYGLLEMPMRHIECLAQEILSQLGSGRPDPLRLASLILQLQFEAVSELAGLGFSALGGYPRHDHHHHGYPYHDDDDYYHHHYGPHHHDDHYHDRPHRGYDPYQHHDHCHPDDPFYDDAAFVERDIDETFDQIQVEPWDWPAAPSSPTVIRSTVPIPVYVSSHERTEIDLDLPPGSQSLDLEIEPPMVAGADHTAPPEPAFEAGFVVLADGPAILRIEVPRDLPAGRYRRRVLIRATGEPVGDLTVQLGTVPKTSPKARPRVRKQ